MKRTINAAERYERPSAARFAPCETTKKAVRTDWIDADSVARDEVESKDWRTENGPTNYLSWWPAS